MKVRNPPGSGKDIAEDKGVHREMESEGSRMSGKVLTRRANLWPDEQKSSIRLQARVRLQDKLKPNNCTESLVVKMAGGWRERNVWYPWEVCAECSERSNHRTRQRGGAERAEVSRGHSWDVPEEMKAR